MISLNNRASVEKSVKAIVPVILSLLYDMFD